MHEEVRDRVELRAVRDTRCDPLRRLPVELVESILQYVPFRGVMYVFSFPASHMPHIVKTLIGSNWRSWWQDRAASFQDVEKLHTC